MNKHTRDLTRGSVARAILTFALPMMVGALVQDLYSMADMTIAGYTLGDRSIAAISATGAVIGMLNYAARGFNLGNSILLSNAFGAGDTAGAKKAFASMAVLCAGYTLVFTALFLTLLGPLMRLVNTPAELFADAKRYAVILISGLGCTMAYNTFSCAYTALGNSRIPLLFVICASLLNVALDYACIVLFRLGVAGAAVATVASQLLCAFGCGVSFFRRFPELRLRAADLRGLRPVLRDMLPVGLSVALTNSIYSIGAVAVQGALNALGPDAIIAQSAAGKVIAFACVPSVNFANAAATFAAQNYGARKYDRITRGILCAIGLSAAVNVFTYLVAFFLGEDVARLLTNTENADVIRMAGIILKIQPLFMWAQTAVMGFRMCIQSLKRKVIPMLGTGVELAIRCVFAFVITPRVGFVALPCAEVSSWLLSGACMAACYFVLIRGLRSGKYRAL